VGWGDIVHRLDFLEDKYDAMYFAAKKIENKKENQKTIQLYMKEKETEQ
jgi:hypothetical protein